MAEAEPRGDRHPLSQSAQPLAHQILAGDAEIDAPLPSSPAISEADRKATSIFVAALDARRDICASSVGRLTGKPACASSSSACSFRRPFDGSGEGDRVAHATSPAMASMRSSQTEKPTPGTGALRAEHGQQPVVAAAAGQRARCRRGAEISKTRPV